MIEPRRLRPFFLRRKSRTQARLAALRAASKLRQGGVIAHHTATLPGIAATPSSSPSVAKLICFKQRQGPFLLLADSIHTALSLARYSSPALRRLARQTWPGATTLIFVGKPGLPACCYQQGMLAVRVDASFQTCQLAAACGGLLISSSLNRKGEAPAQPGRKLFMRSRRRLNGFLNGREGSGKASSILRVWRNGCTIIRP